MRFGKRAGAIAAVVTGATLVPLVAFGGVGLAAKNAPSAAQYQYKVTVCHYTHSKKHPWVIINISRSALPAHVTRHGDVVVATGTITCPPKATTTAAPTPKHGNSGNNGNSGHTNNGHHGKP
jgi:hypothetical protein